jgi:type II secretory pathway component PulM
MFSLPAKIAAGAVALLVLIVAAMFVLQLGPFNQRPSVAAKAIPKVQATVAATQTQAAAAVGAAEAKTQAVATVIQKRTEDHVVKIRAAPDGGASDAEFYRSVCDTQLYGGSADCRGFGGKP